MKHPLLANDYRLPTTEKINRKTFGHLLNENLITIRLFRLIFGNIDEHFITQFYDPSKCRIHPTIREKNGKKKIYYIRTELLDDQPSTVSTLFKIHIDSFQCEIQMKTCLRPLFTKVTSNYHFIM